MNASLLIWIVTALAVGISIRQCRKPFGWQGRSTVRSMNARHSGVTDWGLSHVTIGPAFNILDVGCGGGRTIEKLASMAPQGRVSGVDYSPASVAVARQTNAALIAAGRVDIREASVSALPFADAMFDLVTAVETHYYWPNPVGDLQQIVRVLKPGGRVLIIAETYRDQRGGVAIAPFMKLLGARFQTLDQHRTWFERAGLTQISIDAEPGKGWMCVAGTASDSVPPKSSESLRPRRDTSRTP